jgi:hypothetical protein
MMNNLGLQTTANTLYYNVLAQQYWPAPTYTITTSGEPPVSKHETAFKIIAFLIDEGIIDGEKFAVKDLISLVAKLSENVL